MPRYSSYKSYDPQAAIDLSLFGHIANEAFVSGAYKLEGNTFARTINYMNNYFNHLSKEGRLPNEFAILKKNIYLLVELEDKIEKIQSIQEDTSSAEAELDHFVNQLVYLQLPLLNIDEYLSLPGGWLTANGSHAMVYQFKRTAEGYLFYIYNSGAGVRYHERKSTPTQELYCPAMAYLIPLPIDNQRLAGFISDLIRPQLFNLHPKKSYHFDERILYEEIIPRLSFLNAQLISIVDKIPHAFTMPQLSDTCANLCLYRMLLIICKTSEDFERLIYGYKRYALDDLIRVFNRENALDDIALENQVGVAIKTMMRTLNHPLLFHKDWVDKEYIELKAYQTLLSRAKKPTPISSLKTIGRSPSAEEFSFIHVPNVLRLAPHFSESISFLDKYPPKPMVGGRGLIAQMKDLQRTCDRLNRRGQYYAMIDCLESEFCKFPLPVSPETFTTRVAFYNEITVYNQHDFYHAITSLQELYLDACKALHGEALLPRMFVVGLSVLSILDYVSHSFRQTKFGPLSLHSFMSGLMSRFFEYNENNPYFATNQVMLDQRLRMIKALYPYSSKYIGMIDYYQGMINSEPALKQDLEKNGTLPEDYQFASHLQKTGLKSLYWFTHNWTQLEKEARYQPLIEKFNLQFLVETAAMHAMGGFFEACYKKNITLSFNTETSTLHLQSMGYDLLWGYHNQILSKHKYGFSSQSPAFCALMMDYQNCISETAVSLAQRSDNYVQLLPRLNKPDPEKQELDETHGKGNHLTFHSADIGDREYYLLRQAKQLQIKLTLDYFLRHIDKLSAPACQIYVEANLFEPGLLLTELCNGGDILNLLDQFIDVGIHYFSDRGMVSGPSLFFIRLNYLVSRYATEYRPELGFTRLEQLQKQIISMLQLCMDNETGFLYTLHQYLFLTVIACYRFTPREISGEELRQYFGLILPSYFYINAKQNRDVILDTATRVEIDCAKYEFKQWLARKAFQWVDQWMGPSMETLGLGFCVSVSQQSLGCYSTVMEEAGKSSVYTVCVEQGRVFNENGMAYAVVPLDILHHPVMNFLKITHAEPCFASQDEKTFELGAAELRFLKQKKEAHYRVQKKWTVNGVAQWYELHALSYEQNTDYQLDVRTINLLSDSLYPQRDTQIWVNCEVSNNILITQNHRPAYRSFQYLDRGRLLQLDDKGVDNGFVLCSKTMGINLRFASFENEKFIVVCQREETVHIQFLRYGFHLIAHQKAGDWVFHPEHHPGFTWVREIGEHMPGVAGLVFEDKLTQQRECYIPLQRFIALDEQSPTSEFYKFEQDTAAKILHATFHALTVGSSKSYCSWQYSNTETLIRYSLDEAWQPYAETAKEALYLAYLYLGTHNPQKAWEVLEDCTKRLGGVEGTIEEFSLLHWIMHALPFPLGKKIKYAAISTPAYTACRLKALALFTHILSPGKTLEFPARNFNLKTPDGLCQHSCLQGLKKFYQTLNQTLYSLYSSYQNQRHYLSDDFQLQDTERGSLLNFYHYNLPGQGKKAWGALGYEWHSLQLNTLKREYQALLGEQKIKGQLPAAYARRLKDIDDFLKQEKSIGALSTELEYLPIDLNLPMSIQIDLHALVGSSSLIVKTWWEDITTAPMNGHSQEMALKALVPTITQVQVLEFFPLYIHLMKYPHGHEYKMISDFCRKFLIANRHVFLEKQENQVGYFINVLYRILINHSLFCKTNGEFLWTKCVDMIRQARALPVPELSIYQIKMKADQCLASSSHIWEALDEDVSLRTKPMIIPDAKSMDRNKHEAVILSSRLHPSTKAYLIDGCRRYKAEVKKFDEALSTPVSHHASRLILNQKEKEAGVQKGLALREMKQIAFEMLNNPLVRKALRKSAKVRIKILQGAKQQQWDTVLAKVKEGPSDLIKKRQRKRELDLGRGATWTESELLSMYCQANEAMYARETDLDNVQIKTLHTLLGDYLNIAIEIQMLQRFCQRINDHALKPEKSDFQDMLHVLLADNLVDSQYEPVLTLFQFYENLLLHPEQIDACKRLIKSPISDPSSFIETIEKIPMGGGKSKVILPLLARIKATGSNLVVIEVPRALLKTNVVDLTHLSTRLFNQKAHRLEFNRDSDGSPENLQFIHSTLLEVIVNKDYLVTTGETIQSLRLKYLECLLLAPEDESKKSIWINQVRSLDTIVNVLCTRADALIDEPHQGLLPKRTLNYSLGECRSLSANIIDECVELFLFFDHVFLQGFFEEKFSGKSFTSLFLQENTVLKPKDARWEKVMMQLATAWVTHPQSPLQLTFQRMGLELTPQVQNDIIFYLSDKAKSVPAFILESDPKFREVFALYKGQMKVLPATLSRQFKVNYGPSKLPSDDAAMAALAIPYWANNRPIEKSRFGNELVSMDLTIQMLMIEGLCPALLSQYLIRLQIQAKHELQKYPLYGKLDNTPTARGLRNVAPDLTLPLSKINEKDEQQFRMVFKCLHKNKRLIADVLKNDVLTQVTLESEFLHSDAYQHVDSYRSCQGITGTPGAIHLYHQRFQSSEQTSTAMDGFIYYLLHDKKIKIRQVEKQASPHFLQALFATKRAEDTVRAIIDVCAAFKGISNEQVSQELAHYIREHPETFALPEPLKYIVFFNQDNVLCALDINQDNKLVVIGSTEPRRLDTLLGCSSNQRFTYYDQSHAEGIDLKQAKTAQALILVDPDTCLQNHFQGCMRLRGLPNDQSLEIILTANDEILSLQELCEKMDENQRGTLVDEVFSAGRGKMKNLIRTYLERRILTIENSDVEAKHRYALAFRKYFVETTQTSLFDKYGRIGTQREAEGILLEQQCYLLEDLARVLANVGEKPSVEEMRHIRDGLDAIIKDTLSICKGTLQTPLMYGLDTEVETQKQLHVELQHETQLEQECFDLHLIPIPYEPWLECPLSDSEAIKKRILSLTDICSINSNGTVPEFGDIFASRNYYQSYENQEKFLGLYLKPIHAILFYQEGNDHLQAFILSQQEADELTSLIKKNPKPNLWITTMNHILLAGRPTPHIQENKTYLEIIEKICFFNGEFRQLLARKVVPNWLSQDTEEKLLFFEKNLLRYRESNLHDIIALRESLSQRQNAFHYIAQHPLKDYTSFDWRVEISPALTDADVEECGNLAQSFANANHDWQTEGMSWQTCQEGLRLSMQATTYISSYYVECIARLKNAFPSFEDAIGEKIKTKVNILLPRLIQDYLPLCRLKQQTLLQFFLLNASRTPDHDLFLEIAEWLLEKKHDINALDEEGHSAFDLVLHAGGQQRYVILKWLINRKSNLPSSKESWRGLAMDHCWEYFQFTKVDENEPFLLACLDAFQSNETLFYNFIHKLKFTDTLIRETMCVLMHRDYRSKCEQYVPLLRKILGSIQADLSLYEVVLAFVLKFDPCVWERIMINVSCISWCAVNPNTFSQLIEQASNALRAMIFYSRSFQEQLKENADLIKPLLSSEKNESTRLAFIFHLSLKPGLHSDVLSVLISQSKGKEYFFELFTSNYTGLTEAHLKQMIRVYREDKINPPSIILIMLLQQMVCHPHANLSVLEEAVAYALLFKPEIMVAFWKSIDGCLLSKVFLTLPEDVLRDYFQSSVFFDLREATFCKETFQRQHQSDEKQSLPSCSGIFSKKAKASEEDVEPEPLDKAM